MELNLIPGNIKTGNGLNAWNSLAYLRTNDGYSEATGTNAYAATFQFPGNSNITEGMTFKIKFLNANTGASTLNINGIGALALKKEVTEALQSGDIIAGAIYIIYFDGINFQINISETLI